MHPLGADEQGGTPVLQLSEVNACFCLMRNGRDSKLIPILDQLHAMVVVEKTSSAGRYSITPQIPHTNPEADSYI